MKSQVLAKNYGVMAHRGNTKTDFEPTKICQTRSLNNSLEGWIDNSVSFPTEAYNLKTQRQRKTECMHKKK